MGQHHRDDIGREDAQAVPGIGADQPVGPLVLEDLVGGDGVLAGDQVDGADRLAFLPQSAQGVEGLDHWAVARGIADRSGHDDSGLLLRGVPGDRAGSLPDLSRLEGVEAVVADDLEVGLRPGGLRMK